MTEQSRGRPGEDIEREIEPNRGIDDPDPVEPQPGIEDPLPGDPPDQPTPPKGDPQPRQRPIRTEVLHDFTAR